MADVSDDFGSALSNRSFVVALITLTRYLASQDPHLMAYLRRSLENAETAGLVDPDLTILRLLIGAIGG